MGLAALQGFVGAAMMTCVCQTRPEEPLGPCSGVWLRCILLNGLDITGAPLSMLRGELISFLVCDVSILFILLADFVSLTFIEPRSNHHTLLP